MKKIRIQDAVGMVLGHDVTQIVPGKFKGPRFKKGHRIREEDIPEFLKIGKEHVFIMELKAGMIHEDDAAIRLGRAFAGENIYVSGPSEGKVTFHSNVNGLLKVNLKLLNRINLSGDAIVSTLHRFTPCEPGMAVGATRIIPLIGRESDISRLENWCKKEGALIDVIPYRVLEIGVIVTGSELFKGLVEDRFDDTVGKKIVDFGSRIVKKVIVPDSLEQIVEALKDFQKESIDLFLVTGGLSVDPDDVTRMALKKAGVKIVFYGTPVLPGAMFLFGFLAGKPLLGLPACVFHHNATLFDVIFPRFLAGEYPSRKEVALLGHGGFCRNCSPCHFPVCPFGKG